MKITKQRLKEIIREEIQMLTEKDMIVYLQGFGFEQTDFDNGVQFLIHKKAKLDAWHDLKSMNVMVGRQNGRDNKVFKGSQDDKLGQYLQKQFKLKLKPKESLEDQLDIKKDVKKYLDAMKKEFPKIQKKLLEY